MTRNVDDVYTIFFDKVEEDVNFFSYYGIDDAEAMALAKERASSYLRESIAYIKRQAELDFDLSLMVDESGMVAFAEEITDVEADILSEVMLMRYFERGLAKLKPKINVLSSSDLKVLHSPANERTSYNEMLCSIRENIVDMISHYVAVDRLTGKRKMVEQTIPGTDGE